MHRFRLRALALTSVLGLAVPIAHAAVPQLVANEPILCMDDPNGVRVRVQCDLPGQPANTCLFAPTCFGNPCEELERVTWCAEAGDGQRWADYVAKDYAFIPARADVPPGYYRDEEGRAFQVNFDLNQRMWLGASYLHTFSEDGGALGPGRGPRDGVLLDMGFRADYLLDGGRSRNRFRFLEAAFLPAPLQVRASLLRFDNSSAGDEPFARITTFIGGPARHDLYLQGGWWLDLLAVDHHPRNSQLETHVRLIGGGVTWDLWQDADLTSFLRFKLGIGLDDIVRNDKDEARFVIAPLVALEGDFTFDDEGFHHLVLSSRFEAAFVEDPVEKEYDYRRRFESEIAYELILIAIDDQPLTLHVGVSGGYRDDLLAHDGWEVSALAGLRFSLWAPPRDLAARDEIVARRRGKKQ